MINNLSSDQLDDIHYFFNYFSGRRTTLESELKLAETVDLSQRLGSDSAPDQHLLMKAYCEYSQQFVGHGFFYLPVEEAEMDKALKLAFAGLHPQRYIPDFKVEDGGNETPRDLLSRVEGHIGTLIKNLDGTRETIKLQDSKLVVSYKKVREILVKETEEGNDEETDGENDEGEHIPSFLGYFSGDKLDLKDWDGYRFRLGIDVEALPNPSHPKCNLGEIEDAVREHLSELVKFTYVQSGLLEEFPILKAYVRGESQVIGIPTGVNLNWRKIRPGSDEKSHCEVNFSDPCATFRLSSLESRFGSVISRPKGGEKSSREPIPKSFLFDLCCQDYLTKMKFRGDLSKYRITDPEIENIFQMTFPEVFCNLVENLFREAYPKRIAELEVDTEKEKDSNLKVRRYCQLVSLQALSNLDLAYQTLAKAVRWDRKHGKHFKFDDWNGGVKTI